MEIIDDQPPDDTEAKTAAEAELDGLKIRQFTALRRGAIRQRSWSLIAAALCVIGALQLIINAIQLTRHERSWGLWQTLYILIAPIAVYVALYFLKKARALKREIENSNLQQPEAPPDFSTLSDGSERWKNLEDIR
jgi:hypothetical protein